MPAPSLADLTLTKAMAGSDLRMQLVTWSNRHVFGRAWVEGLDEMPRPAWILKEKPAPNGVTVKVSIALPDVSADSTIAGVSCTYDVTLTRAAEKVSGNYVTAGVEMKSLPVASARGALQGTHTPLADTIRQNPRLAAPKTTGTVQDLAEAQRYGKRPAQVERAKKLLAAVDIHVATIVSGAGTIHRN